MARTGPSVQARGCTMLRPVDRRRFLRLLAAALVAAGTHVLPGGRSHAADTSTPGEDAYTGTGTGTLPATPGPGAESASVADVVYVGRSIRTMDPLRPTVEAIAVRGDRILALGDEDAVRQHVGRRTSVIQLGRRALLPGFIDVHCHRIGDRHVWEVDTPQEAIARTLADGFTSISELFVDQARLDELVALDEAGELRLRVSAYLPVNYLEDKYGIWFEHLRPQQVMSPRVRIGGVKVFADRIDPTRTLLSEDHPGQPGYRGDLFWDPAELADMVSGLHADGWQIAIHSGGDAAHDMVLDAFAAALQGAPNEARHRMEHLTVLRDDQIARIAEMGILASFQLGWFNTLWKDDWEQALPGWTDRLGRWRDLVDSGAPVVGSTDCPWAPPVGPAMLAVSHAVTRRAKGGGKPADWQLRQRLTVPEALELLTTRAAWATFAEAETGMLREGAVADLVILSRDPAVVPLPVIDDIGVLVTMVGGVVEHCAPGAKRLCPPSRERHPAG